MNTSLEDRAKRSVAYRAADEYIADDTCVGLGTGSTAHYAIERVGQLVAQGRRIRAVATSEETEHRARALAIPLVSFGSEPIAVAIDGADEVDRDWSLIKGGGGALYREKAVAIAAHTFVVIVTARKIVERLGAFPLPVEVVPFSTQFVAREIEALGARVSLRRGTEGRAYVTDNGNAILDCRFGAITAPAILDRILRDIHGVVATGLFIGLTSAVLVAHEDGNITSLAPRPLSAH